MYRHADFPATTFGIIERLADCNNVRLVDVDKEWRGYYSHAKPVYPCPFSASYGDFHEVGSHTPINPATTFALVEYATGSDYSGTLVEVSNHKALLELLGDLEDGIDYLDISGGHGTFALAIRVDRIAPDVLEALEGLEDYPLMSEDLHSQMELESQNAAWEDSIREEFRTALASHLDVEDLDSVSDESLAELFCKTADLGNCYWSNDCGSDSWIDVESVIKRSLSHKQDSEYARNAHAEIESILEAMLATINPTDATETN